MNNYEEKVKQAVAESIAYAIRYQTELEHQELNWVDKIIGHMKIVDAKYKTCIDNIFRNNENEIFNKIGGLLQTKDVNLFYDINIIRVIFHQIKDNIFILHKIKELLYKYNSNITKEELDNYISNEPIFKVLDLYSNYDKYEYLKEFDLYVGIIDASKFDYLCDNYYCDKLIKVLINEMQDTFYDEYAFKDEKKAYFLNECIEALYHNKYCDLDKDRIQDILQSRKKSIENRVRGYIIKLLRKIIALESGICNDLYKYKGDRLYDRWFVDIMYYFHYFLDDKWHHILEFNYDNIYKEAEEYVRKRFSAYDIKIPEKQCMSFNKLMYISGDARYDYLDNMYKRYENGEIKSAIKF